MARRDLEVLAHADLERLGMVLPAVTEATVGLVRSGGGGKWHIPTGAIALDRSPRKDDARVRELLRPVLWGDEFGAQAWKAMAGWSQVLERAEEQLAVYWEAPPAVASVTAGAALDAVGREAAVHEQARVLERAVGGDRRWTEVGVWDCVRLS